MKLIWSEFFQTRTAFASTFRMVMLFGLPLACCIGTVLLKLVQFLYFLLKRRWKVLKRCGIEVILVSLIPLVVLFFAAHLSDERVILKSLKVSLEKKDVDAQKLLVWLDTLDVQEIKPETRLFYQNDNIPQDVKNVLSSLEPDDVWLKVAEDNRPYLDLRFTSTFIDLGVIIGVDSQAVMFPTEEHIDVIDTTERVFIWLEE